MAPVTWGVAMDVPLMTAVRTRRPGARARASGCRSPGRRCRPPRRSCCSARTRRPAPCPPAGAAADRRLARQATGHAVEVGDRRDGDDLVVAGRDVVVGVVVLIAGRDHEHGAGGGRGADRLVLGVARCHGRWHRSASGRRSRRRPRRLMFATIGRPGCLTIHWATQSMPQMTVEVEPRPAESKTRTDQRRAPGATPTTPTPLSRAPMVPATWVP